MSKKLIITLAAGAGLALTGAAGLVIRKVIKNKKDNDTENAAEAETVEAESIN